jgi:hypothetical protein
VRKELSILAVGMLLGGAIVLARAQAPAFGSRMLLNNERIQVQRLSVPAGFREPLQMVPNDQIAIQITPADLEVVIDGQKTSGRIQPGTAFYVPKNAPHQFLNMGSTSYDVVVVMLK